MRRLTASLLALGILLAGCGQAGGGADCPAGQRCLRAGNFSDPGSLDPARSFVKQDQTVINDLLVGLTTFDAAGRPAPGIAERWTVSADQLVWTFHLREARWSDGVPMRADDFVYSMRRLVDPKTAGTYASLVYPVRNARSINAGKAPLETLGIRAVDPRTVEIRLEHPTPYLPDVLAHYGVVPVPPHAVARWGEAWTDPRHYVSNGPFRLAEWRLGDRILLVRNPQFYDAASVCLDRVAYLPITDGISAERQVKRGQLDLNTGFASNRIRYLRGRAGMAAYVRSHPWTDVVYLAFNYDTPALRDARVRQALAMAVDREFIAGRLLGAGQLPAHSFVPPGSGALPGDPDWSRLPFRVRQAKARALLAAAGYGKHRPLKLELKHFFAMGLPAQALQADWREIGVEATIASADVAVFFNDLQAGAFEVALTDWIADYPDATNFLNLMRTGDTANYGGYSDPVYDSLVAAGEREADPTRRAQLLQQAERRMLQAAPIAPVYVNPSLNLVNPRVTGWVDNINDVHPKRWVCLQEGRGTR